VAPGASAAALPRRPETAFVVVVVASGDASRYLLLPVRQVASLWEKRAIEMGWPHEIRIIWKRFDFVDM